MSRFMAVIENMENSPQKIMGDSLSLISTDYHPRTRIMNMEYLDEITLLMVEEVYRDRFADASDFFFVIVGNMEAEEVQSLARRYIGAIPDLDRKEHWIDRGVNEPDGVVKKTIPLALETPKANVNVIFNKPVEYSPRNRVVMMVIEGILELRFDETIREEEGGTYGVSAGVSLQRWPEEKGTIRMTFDCDPEKAEELKSILYRELDKLAGDGPSDEDLSKTVENFLKKREENREHNSYYLNTIYSYYLHGINFDDPANYEEILKDLSTKDVKKFMKKFNKDPNIVDVVFVPLETEEETPAE
jgi:zinc protease